MKQILRYTALVILLASVFLIAHAALDSNDRWRGCEIDNESGVVTCVFVEHTPKRGGETYVDAGCLPPTIPANGGGYRRECSFRVGYVSHIIEGE